MIILVIMADSQRFQLFVSMIVQRLHEIHEIANTWLEGMDGGMQSMHNPHSQSDPEHSCSGPQSTIRAQLSCTCILACTKV